MASAIEELRKSREHLVSQLLNGTVPEDFQANHTEIMDQYFRKSLLKSETGHTLFKEKVPFALVALGGYGRKELSLHSDIDIQILFGPKIPPKAKGLAEEIFYPLWDAGLDLGYATRSIKHCLSLSKEDFQVLTALMDARFICGHSPLHLDLMENLQKKVVHRKKTALCRWLKECHRIRTEKFGDASHLLEPNLKESIGALRDYHHILWMAKAVFNLRVPRDLEYRGRLSHDEYQTLKKNLLFIWLVRAHLHQVSGRKNDRLSFEYQEKIARKLGFHDERDLLAVEKFMGRIHAGMASIKSLHQAFFNSQCPPKKTYGKHSEGTKAKGGLYVSEGELYLNASTDIPSNPLLLMDIFAESSRSGCPLSLEAKRLVREFLFLVDENFRKSSNAVQGFLGIMNSAYSFETLDQMLETGFLGTFIPEFEHIKDRVQFDTYHIFPVGRHSLETVRYLKGVSKEREILLLDILSDLSNPELIYLAALFHDIGKIGKDHAHRGAAICRKILERFDYENDAAQDVLFLVRNHLLLAETATRRDLNDEKMVVQCARNVGNIERLKMLFLLTWADAKATGPKAWNDWTASLVQELFFKTIHILEREELATPGASQKVKTTQSRVRQLMHNQMDEQDLTVAFGVMTPRYILHTRPHDILRHVVMAKELKKQTRNRNLTAFSMDIKQDHTEGYWEVSILTKDKPGLFSDIAGVLALRNINILAAHIFTWRDGTAVDIFMVNKLPDSMHSEEMWDNVKRDLKRTLAGKLSLDYRLSQKSAPSVLSEFKVPSRAPIVKIDNTSSDFFTLIEVFSDDRIGLLYSVTHTLFSLRLDIRIAKIATKGDQVADIFYVRDLEGQKIEDEDQLIEIEKALLHKIGNASALPYRPLRLLQNQLKKMT